ncbi:MAG: hypothetical protein DLM52_10570 [Chthoniobacterales bacterium]|nr:MAG: hypothetical protein DLM52_10570 [Chthoniobacterales bacterium]
MAPRFFDFSARAKLRITGADRVRLLNGQTTNDVRKSNASATQESCVLNAKGHLEAHLFLFATPEALWIDASEELREQLAARLERYIIADDVTIEDVTDEFALFHVLAPTPPRIPEAKFCLDARRFLENGWDVWCTQRDKELMRQTLAAEAEFVDASAAETLRIEHGIPRWGCELTPEILPPEAGLELRAIDYEKGCYIGQEVISRMKMSGQMRQRLCGVTADQELLARSELRAAEKPAGKITSATFSPRLNVHIALGFIKRGFSHPGTELSAPTRDRTVSVRLAALPFVS